MLNAFMEDQTGFKRKIIALLIAAFLLNVGAGFMTKMFAKSVQENLRLSALYNAQETWLKDFDSKAAEEIEKKMLKPIAEKDLELVQSEQLSIFKKNNVNIISCRQDASQSVGKPKNLKFVKFNVVLESSWENITSALNFFESQHLVVITGLFMEPVGDVIKTSLEYNIYFL